MFCTAIAKVKSDADMASACVIGGRKSPRHLMHPHREGRRTASRVAAK